MTGKRSYIEEILTKQQRLLKRAPRFAQFERRIHPLVRGFRSIKALDKKVSFRDEWLKYGAIGYVAGLEGYFRLLFADLIDHGPPFSENIVNFKDIKITLDIVSAIHSKKVTLGSFIAHLLPLNNVADINSSMSTILGIDFLKYINAQPTSKFNPEPFGKVFPEAVGRAEQLFQLRHLYCHELATKERVSVRKIEKCIEGAAGLVVQTEDVVSKDFLGEHK